MIPPQEKPKVKEILEAELKKPVEVILFTQKYACHTCIHALELLQELASLNPNIVLKVLYLEEEKELSKKLNIDKVPAILIKAPHGKYNLRFYGLPTGYEFSVLLDALIMASSSRTQLKEKSKEALRKITKNITIKVFVTPTCPYCPTASRNALMAAIENPHLLTEIIEISEYPHLAQKYNVQAVPKTVINEKIVLEGAYPEDMFIKTLASIAGVKISYIARETYDVLIIGGGGAGVTAAIYSVRRGLKTALVERKDIGGQLLEASTIENYPGLYGVMGPELAQLFKMHLLEFNVDLIYDEVMDIRKKENIFEVILKSGEVARARTVIIASGMEHRRLNIPGEKEYLGKGVSYCAVCDGALYKNKVVAVIGGGSTAVSYALYLSDICKKVYLIHRRKQFRAEDILVKQLRERSNIEILVPYVAVEIIGENSVKKLKIVNRETITEKIIDVDGVFIAIGHEPNVSFLKSIKPEFNKKGFIKVDARMRTSIEGLFAAGDITGIENQLVVACAQGAIAALTAAKYLKEKEPWSFKPIN